MRRQLFLSRSPSLPCCYFPTPRTCACSRAATGETADPGRRRPWRARLPRRCGRASDDDEGFFDVEDDDDVIGVVEEGENILSPLAVATGRRDSAPAAARVITTMRISSQARRR